jgi:hypothetical protein
LAVDQGIGFEQAGVFQQVQGGRVWAFVRHESVPWLAMVFSEETGCKMMA